MQENIGVISKLNSFIQASGAQFPMSFAYKRNNNNGPRTHLRGTPQVISPK